MFALILMGLKYLFGVPVMVDSTSSPRVVTRFAPSPTGYLHIGGARTALFNWLLAKKTGGKFILRIEDTDLKRNTPTATQQVIDDLKWLGITWDEGPEIDGPNAPYFQSQRRETYDKYVGQLLEQGRAYYCFETGEELEKLRKQAEAQKKGFVYQRPAVFPTKAEVEKAKAEGKSVTIRFAMPEGTIVINDIVRGEVSFNTAELGDFIIIKSDGFPTYNFACVIDDHLMGITHVIRGQEHLMNTPGQQALWQALGFGNPPQYAHMSVTISESGGKLSKRERPQTLRKAIKAGTDIDLVKLASVGGLSADEMKDFLKGESVPPPPTSPKPKPSPATSKAVSSTSSKAPSPTASSSKSSGSKRPPPECCHPERSRGICGCLCRRLSGLIPSTKPGCPRSRF